MGRLAKKPDSTLQRLLIAPGVERDLKANYNYFLEINDAHASMLQRSNLLSSDEAREIRNATAAMRESGPHALQIDPELEDLFFNIEAELMRRVGPSVGGKLHTGRSRNDILATAARMRFRDELTQVIEDLFELRRTLIDRASQHLNTVVSGYTHLQAAEPITLGHYFAAAIFALERDHDRIRECLERVNHSPLGSAAMASTTFPIDRKSTANELGFSAPMENSLDGVASRDFAAEGLAALSMLTNDLSRFSHDLWVWCSAEFGYADVDSAIAVTSSIMPQKKNPVTLEHIKSKTAHVQAAWMSCMGSLKAAAYSHSRESSVESLAHVWTGISEARAAVELFTHTIVNINFDTEVMLERARKNFSCVTELANEIVRQKHLDFRTAHHIVGDLVAVCLEAGQDASSISSQMLDESAVKYVESPLRLSDDEISRVLDPQQNVSARTTLGGPASEEVARQLAVAKERLTLDRTDPHIRHSKEITMSP